MVPDLGREGLLRSLGVREALLHHDPPAQRDRNAAHGPRVPGHDHGRPDALPPHAETRHPVAARQRPRRDRHPDGGGTPAQRGGTHPPGHRTRGFHRAGVEVEGGLRRRNQRAAPANGRIRGLAQRALHHGRGTVGRGDRDLRPAIRRGAHLSRQPTRQLGSGAAHRHLRPGSDVGRGGRPSLAHPLPARGRPCRPRGRHHPAGDDARRHRGRGAPRGRALPGLRRPSGRSASRAPSHPGDRRRSRGPLLRQRVRQDHAGARFQRLPGGRTARSRADQHLHPRRAHQRRRAAALPGPGPLRGEGNASLPI